VDVSCANTTISCTDSKKIPLRTGPDKMKAGQRNHPAQGEVKVWCDVSLLLCSF